jgi:transcriptional regulator with XRE-family HTH domain
MYRFRECRENADLTQKYVAISLNVKPPSVSDWEKGNTNPTLENLIKLAKLYQVSTDYLLGVEEQEAGLPARRAELTQAEKKLVEDFRSLNQQGKEYILQTMAMATKIYKQSDAVPGVENQA